MQQMVVNIRFFKEGSVNRNIIFADSISSYLALYLF